MAHDPSVAVIARPPFIAGARDGLYRPSRTTSILGDASLYATIGRNRAWRAVRMTRMARRGREELVADRKI